MCGDAEHAAAGTGIRVRTGCFGNPSAAEAVFPGWLEKTYAVALCL
jgi:hypothetical protein